MTFPRTITESKFTKTFRMKLALLFHLCLLCCAAKAALAATTLDLHQAAADALRSKNYNKALDFLSEAIQIDPNDSTLLNTIGVVFDAVGDVDRAADYFSSSLKIDPASFSTNYNAANLMHYGIFDKNAEKIDALESSTVYYLKAYESLVSSKDGTHDSISKGEQFRFLTDASIAMMKAQKYLEAIQLFTKALDIDPNNSSTMSDLSLAYLGSGDFKTAQQYSSMAIARSPDDAKLRRNHALIDRNASAVPDESTQQVQMNEIVFGMSFDHQSGENDEIFNIKIELKRSDDPVAILNELQSQLELDLLTYRWLYCNFHHALARLNENVVFESPIDVDGRDLPIIRVHFGDDLYALSKSYAYQHGLTSDVANVIYMNLVNKVSQHSEVTWVNARKRQLYKAADPTNERDYMSVVRNNRGGPDQCKITLAIVTTGELQSLYNLIAKLPTSNHLCDVMVFDYLSTEANKMKVVQDFPQFDFVFFAKEDHAKTLNSILRTIKTPYVLHMNDSWEPIGDISEKIDIAYLLMEATQSLRLPVAQVLMNEQSSQACAFGLNLSECRDNDYYGKAGWPRRITVDEVSFDFIEHEFGVQYEEHQRSSSWPGFSSHHPALWNLNLLTSNVNVFYNEGYSDYDLTFALKVMESGMTTAHLKDVAFRYIGR